MKERIRRIYCPEKASEYLSVLDELEQNKISYILLNIIVADDNPGDLDILLLNTKAKEVAALLQKLGFSYYAKYDTQQYLWNKYLKGVGFVQIHLYESISYQGKRFLPNHQINTFLQEDVNFNFYVFLIESLYKYKLRPKQYTEYKQLLDLEVFHRFSKGLAGEELADYMVSAYEGRETMSKAARNKYFRKSNWINSALIVCRRILLKIYRLFFKRDKEVLFLGVDGAGKTTVIDRVRAISGKGGLFPLTRYMGLRESRFSNNNDSNKEDNSVMCDKSYRRPVLPLTFLRIVKLLLYWLEYNLKYLFRVRMSKQSADSLFLIDRCYIDLLYYYPYKIVERFFLKYSFVPSKIVFLTGDKEVLYNRKKEMSKEQFDILFSFYKDIANLLNDYNKNFIVINTTDNDIRNTTNKICDFIMLN